MSHKVEEAGFDTGLGPHDARFGKAKPSSHSVAKSIL